MTTIQFEYDPERLIEEVKKRPGIWDFDDLNYRSKEMRHKLWNEIVQELLQCTGTITKSERRELELQLQKKWKSIRDCYQKYIQKPNRTKRPYIYYKQLQFLGKNEISNESLNTTQNDEVSSESDGGRKHKTWKSKKKLKLVKNEDSSADDDIDNNFQDEVLTFSNHDTDDETNILTKHTRSSKSLNEFAFANVDAKTECEDPDKMFLVSLLPHLKAIPEEARLDAKMEMMQVLRNAKYCASDPKLL